MKNKILIFIIGLLVGAVVTAAGFLIYEKVNKNTNQIPSGEHMQMMERPDGETPPEKPDGENSSEKNDKATPPEKPSGSDNNEDRPEPPTKSNSSTDNKTN